MLIGDVQYLVCTSCDGDLSISYSARTESDRYLIEGTLSCASCGKEFPVTGGVARFLDGLAGYNVSWNYKWTAIDQGRGLNHAILDTSDPAYNLHDIYHRNDHGKEAFRYMRGRRAIEIGCGAGQYVVKSLLEHAPTKIVAFDLTEGVDTLRRVMVERYPHLLDNVLFVQGSVFSMPFRHETFDYVYSLGVLHHTGNTVAAIKAAARLLRDGGHLNIWVYAASLYHIDTREKGREHLSRWLPLMRLAYARLQARAWYSVFSSLTPKQADRVLRVFSSEAWYKLSRMPVFKILPRLIMSPPPHPNRDYRHINLFDGFVNSWAENWSEAELFPILRDCNIVIKGISQWRVGIWGIKDFAFYQPGTPYGKGQ